MYNFRHPVYFMKQKVYDLANRLDSLLNIEPFNHLKLGEPLIMLHHLNSHEIEFREGRERFSTEMLLEEGHSDLYMLSRIIEDYNEENSVKNITPRLPKSERDLGRRALAIDLLLPDYFRRENVSENPEEVKFDLIPINQSN